MKLCRLLVFSFFFCLFIFEHRPCFALTAEEFLQRHAQITHDYNEITQKLGTHYLPKKTHTSSRRMSPKKVALYSQLRVIKPQKEKFDHIFALKEDLKKMYLEKNKTIDHKALDLEATKIAILVFDEIVRLKKKYKSFFIPLVHNMLIDVGMKKRGACKHWAEDLLTFLRTIDRKYFFVTWGEAHPGKMGEHNVAVIFPDYAQFHDGILIDPWRTSGDPFWVRVKKDKKYPWQPWDDYGIF